jgi:hypothetical protein
MTALDVDDPTYTDSLLGGMIDDLGMEAAVKQVWLEKAASVAALVDITESGSSRSFSKLRDAYLGMASSTGGTDTTATGRGSFTVGITRV